ncbi:ras association domain-containing protein 1 [Nerophis lumbriciformis]|uniref:ras association domain-containing protein 1 n=1 Tax=Nerophis lumbriciformis TaxID=546530 RepID=UPI002AE07D94|nr:ras association domain-containing protein 1-like [Nerophis lumbriciformis]XP_061788214.1 ras association domain-containing protein 1-like [Nerophis lumbriciformis]XP_061788216.1 ras association domain-containing protein 1-like [Nerophis lumbriciformis]XP_061788217.1 ras association domain-containing protein 1-like [Nerophis lumbriciformis]
MSKCELIELKDLSVNDPIELVAPGPRGAPSRVGHFHLVRLVGDTVRIEAPPTETGSGHDFQPYGHTHLSWCDLCGEFIWGLYKQPLRCINCSYTCHHRCRALIQLDCSTDTSFPAEQVDFSVDSIETDTNVDEQTDWPKRELSVGELHQKVQEYNAQINSNLYMLLNKDGSYTGFIKVHFQLVRPVTLPPPQDPTQDEYEHSRRLQRRTSFYLPKDAAKHLHISSRTRVREVIQALLNKFTVVDNPAKFALFERADRHSQVYMRKLSDDECPLRLRLCAGPSEKVLSLVLKENETGEVNWDAFSFPELCNFLRILQREEEEHSRQIVRRYAYARDLMTRAMARITAPA